MNWRIVWAILCKELLDTVRDKRTLVMMLGVPLVLYPGLTLLMTQVAIVQQSGLDQQSTRVALAPDTPARFSEWLCDDKRLEQVSTDDAEVALREGKADVVIAAAPGFEEAILAKTKPEVQLRFDATEFRSREGLGRVREVIEKRYDAMRTTWLEGAGLSEAAITPFSVAEKNMASEQKRSGTLLGLTLPVLLVIMLALGAFYPAVDLTAGEKERGTFETLLSTPTSKLEIVTGKFLTVLGLSMLTALLNFASMGATLWLVLSQARAQGAAAAAALPEIHLGIGTLGTVILVLIPLALLISALMMSVAVFAKSFKEAQNYLTPFIMLIMLPAAVAGLPGMDLSARTALLPIANVVLLFKDLMTGEAHADMIFVVMASNIALAGLALLAASAIFQREDVVLGGGSTALLPRRADFRSTALPTPGLAMGTFFTVMLLILYLGTLLQARALLPGLLLTEFGLILAPCLMVLWYCRIDLRSALLLHAVRPVHLLGAVLCGLGALVLVMQVGAWHNRVLPVPPELREAFADLFASGNTPMGLAILLLVVALTPAICEEVLFRGVIFTGLRDRMSPVAYIVIVGVLFGAFHLSIHRFLSTALLGALLTYVAWRSRSIFPGMLVHALVNGVSIVIASPYMPESLSQSLHLEQIESEGVWTPLLLVGTACFAVGIALLHGAAPKVRAQSNTP